MKTTRFLSFQLDQWPRFIAARFQYTIYPITFSVGDADEWKKLFKPCAAQRLFLPVRLRFITSVVMNGFTRMADFFIEHQPSPGTRGTLIVFFHRCLLTR